MTCLPTTREGFVGAIGWYCASRIVGQFDRDYAAWQVKVAADPGYKGNPFADKANGKGTAKTTASALAAVVERVRAGKAAEAA